VTPMAQEPRHLAVLREPYRGGPPDRAYVGREEVPNCYWCRWRRASSRVDPEARLGRCSHPEQMNQHRHDTARWTGQCSDWNRAGDCPRYEPTVLTRLFRWIGLRRPAWRIVSPETYRD
jgi:hypothetical protein